MGVRPQTRGTAMKPGRPPARRRRGLDDGRPPPGDAVGRADARYRTRKKNKGSDAYIVRGRRRGKGQAKMSRSSKKGPWVEESA